MLFGMGTQLVFECAKDKNRAINLEPKNAHKGLIETHRNNAVFLYIYSMMEYIGKPARRNASRRPSGTNVTETRCVTFTHMSKRGAHNIP